MVHTSLASPLNGLPTRSVISEPVAGERQHVHARHRRHVGKIAQIPHSVVRRGKRVAGREQIGAAVASQSQIAHIETRHGL